MDLLLGLVTLQPCVNLSIGILQVACASACDGLIVLEVMCALSTVGNVGSVNLTTILLLSA